MQMNSVTVTNPLIALADTAMQKGEAENVPFAGFLKDAMRNMQQLEDKASEAVQGMLDGSGVDVHTAMIAVSNADAAFELALSVRNKGMAAFQQLMNMQF